MEKEDLVVLQFKKLVRTALRNARTDFLRKYCVRGSRNGKDRKCPVGRRDGRGNGNCMITAQFPYERRRNRR